MFKINDFTKYDEKYKFKIFLCFLLQITNYNHRTPLFCEKNFPNIERYKRRYQIRNQTNRFSFKMSLQFINKVFI